MKRNDPKPPADPLDEQQALTEIWRRAWAPVKRIRGSVRRDMPGIIRLGWIAPTRFSAVTLR